jgi:hypothetical protein
LAISAFNAVAVPVCPGGTVARRAKVGSLCLLLQLWRVESGAEKSALSAHPHSHRDTATAQCRFQPVSGFTGRPFPRTNRPFLLAKLRIVLRSDAHHKKRLKHGMQTQNYLTPTKQPILHCARPTLRSGRGHVPLNVFFLGMACRPGNPVRLSSSLSRPEGPNPSGRRLTGAKHLRRFIEEEYVSF